MTTQPPAAVAPPLTAQERAWLIVNHPRVAMDLEQNIVAAIAAAEQAARLAQMETDCAAVCEDCKSGAPYQRAGYLWHAHGAAGVPCGAQRIRAAWAERQAPQ